MRKILHPTIYATVALLYLVMEVYMNLRARCQDPEAVTPNRAQSASLCIALSFLLHLSLDLFLPKLVPGPDVFTVKALISTCLFYIVDPFATIWFNENMCVYVELELVTRLTCKSSGNRVSPATSAA